MNELRQQVKMLSQENEELRSKLAAAIATIKKLTEQLNQNSRNSNWPSSRDKGRSPKPKSLRKRSQRKAGGQVGHKGHTLAYNPMPEIVKKHRPPQCEHCHAPFTEDLVAKEIAKRQVVDLPPLHFVTTEHQVETIACPCCGETTQAQFPTDVTNPVQYGSQVKRLAVYLRSEQFVPYERSRQLLADLFELPISTGSLQNFVRSAAQQVKPATAAIKDAVTQAEVAHADETGFYIGGKRNWLHTVSTSELTYCEPHARRGRKATEAIGILPKFEGTLVHDAWATYFTYQIITHALCNVHHLRDLTAIVENDQQQWASLMIACLLAAKQQVAEAREEGKSALSSGKIERINHLYTTIVTLGLAENPLPEAKPPPPKRRGKRKKTKARNLVERFEKRQAEILRFVNDFKVPFDNNLAERDIRMMKVQQKISGCFRSQEGADQFCRLRSYISTIRKQGLNVWEALGSLFGGAVLMPNFTPV